MGRYDLNLAEVDFWELTLKELDALNERHKEAHNWLNYRAGLICAVLANTARDPKKKLTPFVPDDFMPKEKHRHQTAEQLFAMVQMLNAVFGGTVVES